MLVACKGDTNGKTDPPPATRPDTTTAPENGINEIRDEKGNLIMRGEKLSGKREGGWESYFPNGTLRSRGTFMNGVREGPTTVYHENGAVFYTGWYRKGTPVGEWLFYELDGTIKKRVRYNDEGFLLEEVELDTSPAR